MDRRLQFVAEYLTGWYSMIELAAAYGVSRRSGYYWVRLYQREGAGRLAGASRRPHHSPTATPPAIVERIVAASHAHSIWGAGQRRQWLQRQALRPATHLVAPSRPNLVWTADYKGAFRTRDGHWCDPFTLRDGYSRFVLR